MTNTQPFNVPAAEDITLWKWTTVNHAAYFSLIQPF